MSNAVSLAAFPSVASWNGVCASLAEIVAGQEELGRFLGDVFAQMERFLGEVVRRKGALEADGRKAEEALQQRIAALERQRAELRAEREAAVQDAAGQATQAADRPPVRDEFVAQLVSELEQQRATLQGVVANAEARSAEWAQAKNELTQAREALLGLAERWTKVESGAAAAEPSQRFAEELHRMEQERAAIEQERAVLERELEAVRSRAAELSEMLAGHQRQMAEERSQWSDELKRMRRLLEVMSQRQSAQQTAAEYRLAEPVAAAPAAAAPAASGDPVLGSVLAQFEILQRDLARRRKVAAVAG